jgi:hypothetical protein
VYLSSCRFIDTPFRLDCTGRTSGWGSTPLMLPPPPPSHPLPRHGCYPCWKSGPRLHTPPFHTPCHVFVCWAHQSIGEHTFTVAMPLGRRNTVCKLEVHMRGRGYRVTSPKCTTADKPWVAWADFDNDLHRAWLEVKSRALRKLQAMHPDCQI